MAVMVVVVAVRLLAVVVLVIGTGVMVVVNGAIGRAGVGHRLVHDLPDGARAPSALPAATKTAIDFAGGERFLGGRHHVPDIVVGQDIA
jgi:hypothetical protein